MPRPLSRHAPFLAAAVILSLGTTAPKAQTVLPGSHSIEGHLCVGIACTGSEAFTSFAGMKIKQTRPGLYLEDTSTGDYPSVDWEIRPGGVTSTSEDSLTIRNVETGADLLFLSDGARDNAIFLDDNSDIGFGTSLPLADLHIMGEQYATLRLEENFGASQTWQFSASDFGFRLQDVTENTIPFEIEAGAPAASLHIDDDGTVGVGTPSPDAPLEVAAHDTFSYFRITANDAPVNQSVDVVFTEGPLGTGEFRYNIVDGDGPEMRLNADGDMVLDGTLTTGGPTCASACDAVFDASYDRLSVAEHAALMWENGHLPAIGPTVPGASINLSERIGTLTNELEHAHIYIEQLHTEAVSRSARIDAQDKLIATLITRLDALESK
uniref:hypothetical protein n=1 Tax=Roseovarius indicus TaxID=540747 RepID=UPI003B523815